MLVHLHIRELAIITRIEIDLHPGMTTLTGETGAGKSILIDALGLVLGDRADSDLIRNGSARAEISAQFQIEQLPSVQAWLQEQSLESGSDCILRRVLMRDGPSRAYINGSPVPARSLQQLGEQLVEIHGQHAHHALLQRERQRDLLDDYAGHRQLRQQLADRYRQWQSSDQQLQQLIDDEQERSERADLLQFQIGELTSLAVTLDELQQLDRDQRRLSNASLLQQRYGQLLGRLYDNEQSVQEQLSRASVDLDELLTLDPDLSECQQLVESALIQVQEAVSSLRDQADRVEINPQLLQQVEQRLVEIHDLARKYRCKPAQLPERLQQFRQTLEQLQQHGRELDQLRQLTAEQAQAYMELANRMSELRGSAAVRLADAITQGIATLGMPDGRVQIQVEQLPAEQASASGLDRVEIQISTNPGQPLRPLAKVASGGELSRISLAIQVATIRCAQVPTLVFDEVDVGIGGGVAEIVGRMLRQLGDERQVLCVTHLPQVAAQGHQQSRVDKESNSAGVTTRVQLLDGAARVDEVARMLGGVEITDHTLNHAREMIERAGG